MAVLRFIASLFLLVAVVAFVSDVSRPAPAGAAFRSSSFLKHWGEIAPNTLSAAKSATVKATGPWLWDGVVGRVLGLPTYMLFGAMGLIAGYAGRRRRRVNVYVN